MLFQTTQDHEALRAKLRAFAEREIKPVAFTLDQGNQFPDEAVKKLGEMGLMGIPYPAEYGGAGLDMLSYAIAVEELARVDAGAGVILSAHVSLGSWPIFAYGTQEQKRKYLVPLARGEKIGAFGLTEPNAGSDAGGTETTAVDRGDHYVLNGGKIFITNAPKADTYVVFAVTTPDIGTRGISAFIVEKGWKGFEFGDHYDKMGIRSSTTAELIFNDVKVPKENLLGREGYLMHTLPVTETQLVTSKLISSAVWSLCSILAACLSFGILAVLMIADMDLLEQLPRMWSIIREAFARYNMEFWGALAFSGVVGFVRMVSAIACIYAACMVGHQFKNHPALAGILSFFVMQYVQGWLEKLLQIGTGVYETIIYSAVGDMGSIETAVSALGYMGSAMVTLGIAAAFGVFWFGLTVWLMRNKLNLE